jgi:hypothetical protein
VEAQQCWDLVCLRDGHVIFNSVQSTQDQIEDADRIPQGVGQLLDHHSKAAAQQKVRLMTASDGLAVAFCW